MDYLVYITALLLTLAGLVIFRASSQKAEAIPFVLGVAMLASAVLQIWPLVWLQDVEDPILQRIYAGLVLATVILLQYSAWAIRETRRLMLVCLLTLLLGVSFWTAGGALWIHTFFWPLGGFLAAILLFLESRKKQADFRHSLQLMTLGAAMTSLLVPPSVAFEVFWAPVSPSNPAAMKQIQIFLGSGCWLMGAVLWYRSAVWRSLPFRPKPTGERPFSSTCVLLLLFLGLLAGGWPALEALSCRIDDQRRQELIQQTRLAVFSMEDLPAPVLLGEDGETSDPQYLALKKELQTLAKIGDYSFVYLIFPRGEDLIFLADSAKPGSGEESKIGDVWISAPPGLRAALLHREFPANGAITVGPYKDDWGAWVTGVSSLSGWKIGESQVFLCMDRSAKRWQTSLLRIRQAGMGMLTILMLVVFISFAIHRTSLEAKWQIAESGETLRVLSAALDAAANVVVITDSEGIIQWVNPAFTHVSGYTSEEVVGLSPRVLKSGVHPPEFYRSLWSELQKGGVWSGEITNRHKDGHLFTEEATITPVVNEESRITHYIAVKQDITARKRNEEELEHNRTELRKLALVAENTTNAVLIADTAGRIQWVNPGFQRITGFSLDEVLGQFPGQLLQGPGTDSAVRARMHEAVAAGRGFKEVILNYTKQRIPYWISIECVPLKESDGTHIGFMAIEEDITGRVHGEETLNRQRTNLRHINSTLLNLGDSYEGNLEALTHLAGEIFNADCALYNRLDGTMLKTLGRFNAPPELPFQDTAEGHLCFDVINSTNGFLCVENLQQSHYEKSDPNVGRFKLETYVGQGVKVGGRTLGALSVIFTSPFQLESHLKECLFLIAQAIGREELLQAGRQKLDQLARREATASTRLATLLQDLSDAVLVEDADRRVVFANPAFEGMFGIKASGILGLNCALLADGASQAFEDPEGFLRSTQKATENRTPIHGELLTLKNGCALLRNFTPIGEGTSHYGFLWHYRDVTRQRNNELLLNAVTSLASSILEKPLDTTGAWNRALEAVGAPIGVDRTYVFQNDPLSSAKNPSCSQIAEWTRKGISAQIANPELQNLEYSAAGLGRWYQELLEGRAVAGLVMNFPPAERNLLESQDIISIAVVPISVEGKFWGFLGFDDCRRSRNWEAEEIALLQSAAGLISARLDLQRSVKALTRSESKFRTMFELSPVGMALNDLESGRFIEANKALLEMIGYSLKEIQCLNLFELTPDDYHEKDREEVRRSGSFGPYEKEYFLRGGERLPVLLSGMLVRGEDGREFVWSIVQNIAERKRWENNLRTAKEAADAANRAKSTFLATMSHEIRTPLNAIIGMSSLLTESSLSTTQQEYAETIINAGETLLELINDILDYSKVEAGRIDLEIADFLLEDVLAESMSLLGGPAAQKGLEMSCYLDPSLPAVVRGDRTRIKQVLINLISNAVKFTAKGEVCVNVASCSSADIPRGICFSVCDSGIGMTPDVIANLFQPFQQADSSVTRKFGGTGLGLAISRRLADLMKGHIQVESTPGEGSCFSFEIPCIAGTAPKQTDVVQEMNVLAGKAVLILDDNSTNRRFLHDQCLIWQAIPTDVSSAMEALSLVEKADKPFDLILVDYQMPGMDGAEFARRFRGRYPDSQSVLILLSSAYQVLSNEDRLLFHRTVDKPIRPSSLIKILAGCYGGAAAAPSVDVKPPAEDSSLRILVAEDNATNQKVIMGMLQNLGYSATLVHNGALAVEEFRNQPFDLILLDVQMPVLDGLEAARFIRLEPNGKTPRIVALTANAFKEDREACIRAGMNDYLSKPIQLGQLRNMIRQIDGAVREEAS